MALLNGNGDGQERSLSPAQSLGKRKRTTSPTPDANAEAEARYLPQSLEAAIQLIKRHDASRALLEFPLSAKGEDGRTIKRQRTETPDHDKDNIESRLSRAVYKSLDDLIDDVNGIKHSLSYNDEKVNGAAGTQAISQDRIDHVLDSLSELQKQSHNAKTPSRTTNGSAPRDKRALGLSSGQVLSLRSQTEGGIRQLFSGLPCIPTATEVDGRRLPNGFELADVLTVDKNDLHGRDGRTLGDVFAPHRDTKTLEMPRGARPLRGNVLGFISPYDNISSTNKNDFRSTNLSTGSWLKYSIPNRSTAETDETTIDSQTQANTLFKGAFSSFAPSTDNRDSIVTDFERSQQWWKKYGRPPIGEGLFAVDTISEIAPENESTHNVSDEELERTVANFIGADIEAADSDEILEEVADLIETLSSFQSMRCLEIAKGPSSASKPSEDEQTTYEMLRSQLQLLVCGLPPFAVAKLNGDQLEELNISTRILVSAPEFVGTGQVDEYTSRRNRVVQATVSAAGRIPASVPGRTTYGTPASAYNAQARAYNNIPHSAYAARPPTLPMYNTPRPATNAQAVSYTQPPYRSNGPTIHTPSVQQFQRPVINGYGAATTQTPHTPYLQRPTQPGYQQRAQDVTAYGSVQKPAVNGDASHHQQRLYGGPNNSHPSTPSMAGQHQLDTDMAKQRQTSGTPQPRGLHAEAAIVTTS